MSGTLFVVATPIGNLEDVTLRALRVLGEVDLIAAEDTRRTAHLLARHGIASRSVSFHQHNVRLRVPQILSRLQAGERVALVTDAGTPGVSDPGVELVNACIRAEIPIDVVPGVSAPLAAGVASGFPLIPLTIFGFAPRRSKDRTSWLAALSTVAHTMTFFESPHRIASTLAEASKLLGERPIMVGRELTKLHQQFIRGTAASLSPELQHTKGEITVVIGPLETPDLVINQETSSDRTAEAMAYFGHLTDHDRVQRRAALTAAARKFGLSSKALYSALERAKQSLE